VLEVKSYESVAMPVGVLYGLRFTGSIESSNSWLRYLKPLHALVRLLKRYYCCHILTPRTRSENATWRASQRPNAKTILSGILANAGIRAVATIDGTSIPQRPSIHRSTTSTSCGRRIDHVDAKYQPCSRFIIAPSELLFFRNQAASPSHSCHLTVS
jgi:hypothetical protein